MSIVSNALLICEKYSSAVVLWLVMSSVMLKRCRKQKNTYIVSIIFIVYPIYNYTLFFNKDGNCDKHFKCNSNVYLFNVDSLCDYKNGKK